MFFKRFKLQDEANGGDEGGAGGAGGDQGGQQPGTPPAGGDTSLLNSGKTAEQIAADTAAAGEFAYIPEKYQVKGADGKVDVAASAKKLSEGHTALEKRMGAGDAPPKTADEYTFKVPTELEGQWDPAQDEQYNAFKSEAHKLGFTQAQFEYAVGTHLKQLGEINNSPDELTSTELKEALSKSWKTEKEFNANVGASYRAVAAYANPGSADVLGSYVNVDRKFGNDPDFIALMANIGKETAEDVAPLGSILPSESVEELQKSKAYWDENDPKHAEVKAKVSAHYSRLYK